jgi:hypothetical protein
MKYRKKPVEVEAMIFTYPPHPELVQWMGKALGRVEKARHPTAIGEAEVRTLEDGEGLRVKHIATENDYIIKGVQGEFYPCKPDIFEMTYERVKD